MVSIFYLVVILLICYEAVMSMCVNARTVVRTVYSEVFDVWFGMHQGSGLSPLLFAIATEAISRSFELVYLTNCYLQMIWW